MLLWRGWLGSEITQEIEDMSEVEELSKDVGADMNYGYLSELQILAIENKTLSPCLQTTTPPANSPSMKSN